MPLAEGVDAFFNNAGWASFGLAGLIISWLLLKYLPSQEKKIEKMNKEHAEEIKELNERHDERVAAINMEWMRRAQEGQKSFEASLERIHSHNREMMQMFFKEKHKSKASHRLGRTNEGNTEE